MANRHERRFMATPSDVSELYDAIFVGLEEHPGEVIAAASPAGRASFDKVLPNGKIAWRAVESFPDGLPDDWREFNFIVPTLLDIPDHKIPRYLLDAKLEDVSAEQFAYLMHAAVNAVGGRAAYWSFEKGALVQVQMKDQSQFAKQ